MLSLKRCRDIPNLSDPPPPPQVGCQKYKSDSSVHNCTFNIFRVILALLGAYSLLNQKALLRMSSGNWEYHNLGPVWTRIILNRTKHNFGSKQNLRFSLTRKSFAAKTEIHMLGAVKVVLLVFL